MTPATENPMMIVVLRFPAEVSVSRRRKDTVGAIEKDGVVTRSRMFQGFRDVYGGSERTDSLKECRVQCGL